MAPWELTSDFARWRRNRWPDKARTGRAGAAPVRRWVTES